jgi:multiple sugar transport system permease protein
VSDQTANERRAAKTASRPVRNRRPGRWTDLGWAALFLAPATIGLGLFYIWPAIQTFLYSFTTWGPFGGHTWSGLSNYHQILKDRDLRRALVNTVWFALIALTSIPIALVLAALLAKRGRKGVPLYRALMFLPVVTMPAAIAVVWKWLYNHDYGVINVLLKKVGINGPYWLSDPHTALIAIGAVTVWASIGYGVVIMMAGLQSIPPHYYEAAEMDGAGPVRTFFSITVPLLSPTIFFMSVLSVIASLQTFDLVYMMEGSNNPALPDTRTVLYLFYDQAFNQNNRGYAAAISFVLLIVIIIVTGIQFGLQRKWVHYE